MFLFTKKKRLRMFIYTIPCILVWGIYFFAFFPGVMTNDSIAQWMQMESGKFNNWHPVVHTWLIYLLRQIWDSPGVLALFQIIFLSFIWGYAMHSLERKGVPSLYIWIVTMLFALSPVNSILSISLWKDVLYSGSLFLLCVCLFNLVTSAGNWLNSKNSIGLFIIAIAGTILFRHNGFPVLVVTMAILLTVYYRRNRILLKITLITIVSFFAFTKLLFPVLGVKPSSGVEGTAIPMQQFSMVIHEDGELTEPQMNYLQSIMPLEAWKENFNPYWVDQLKFEDSFNPKAMIGDYSRFFRMWIKIGWQNPGLYLEAFSKQTSIIWQIPEKGYTFYYADMLVDNPFHLKQNSLNEQLKEELTAWLEFTKDNLTMIWRPAIYNLLTILLGGVAVYRKGWRITPVFIPVFLNTGIIIAAIPAQDFRYLYANTLIFYFVFLTIFMNEKPIRYSHN